jgi:uncharacterized membrane protein YhaH (DUF805 family)
VKFDEIPNISRMKNLYEPPVSQICGPNVVVKEKVIRDPWWHWIFPHRLGRLNFVVRLLPLEIPVMIWTEELLDAHSKSPSWMLPSLIAVMAYMIWFVMLPRVRDCGLSVWTVLLGLIPVVSGLFGLALLFKASITPFEQEMAKRK